MLAVTFPPIGRHVRGTNLPPTSVVSREQDEITSVPRWPKLRNHPERMIQTHHVKLCMSRMYYSFTGYRAFLEFIFVRYHDWEHFSSIRNLKGPHNGLPHVVETPPHSEPQILKKKQTSKSRSKIDPLKHSSRKTPKVTVTIASRTSTLRSESADADISPYPYANPIVLTGDANSSSTIDLRIRRSPKRGREASSPSSSEGCADRTCSSRLSSRRRMTGPNDDGDTEERSIDQGPALNSTRGLSASGRAAESTTS